ncbi:MAG: sigma-70 family RNA polymerase sigma factor [Oscillospiraceae bacterium]|jgi:RNA polymerase sigma factor (sigma-70 family)|nr:sigma-70 family RNA polymerase sigma factor [Oscillospiraceae bacterium]
MEFIKKIYDEPEYYDIVRNTIIYIAPKINDFDLKDCISEVYMIAMQSKNLEKHPNVHGWLNLTAKNIAKRYINKRILESARFAKADIDFIEQESTADEIENREQYEDLLKELKDKLKGTDYKLFKLKFTERRSIEEIAAIIGIKKHSAEVRISRLKEKIKNILEKP